MEKNKVGYRFRLMGNVICNSITLLQDRPIGGIQQLCGQNFENVCPLPLRGQFLHPERGQKQTFLTPSPPVILST